MLRGILNRVTARRATRPAARRPVGGASTTGAGTAANREIAGGARSLLRGLSRKRRI